MCCLVVSQESLRAAEPKVQSSNIRLASDSQLDAKKRISTRKPRKYKKRRKNDVVRIFTENCELLAKTPNALLIAFLATPVITAQLIGSAYFQAAGKAWPALCLTLLKQGVFLIPLVYFLPQYYGVTGVWMSFPIADVLATSITILYLRRELNKNIINENV